MKPSFYFVLWIVIYPILGLIPSQGVQDYSFIVALMVVWGLSLLLNRLMPNILTYSRASEFAPIMEDVYTGNVNSFKKILSRDAIIETVTSLYFLVAIALILFVMFKTDTREWFALIIFGYFAFGAISRSVALVKANGRLRSNPTSEECAQIVEENYKMDYAAYYNDRQNTTYEEMLPPRPQLYTAFQITSIVIAVICAVLGVLFILSGVGLTFAENEIALATLAAVYFLYGSLATYFGIKDTLSCIRAFKKQQPRESVKL